jgi:hypothetical protein
VKSRLQISVRRPTISTGVYRCFPKSLQVISDLISHIGPRKLFCTSYPVHFYFKHPTIHLLPYELLPASLNKLWINKYILLIVVVEWLDFLYSESTGFESLNDIFFRNVCWLSTDYTASCIVPYFPDLGTNRRRVVSFKPRPL